MRDTQLGRLTLPPSWHADPQTNASESLLADVSFLSVGGTLRVNPESLRNAARAQSEVGTFISGMSVGQSMNSAGTGVSGLLSEAACQYARSIVDTALDAVREDLTKHSDSLSTAADHYHRVDEEFGRRLHRFAP